MTPEGARHRVVLAFLLTPLIPGIVYAILLSGWNLLSISAAVIILFSYIPPLLIGILLYLLSRNRRISFGLACIGGLLITMAPWIAAEFAAPPGNNMFVIGYFIPMGNSRPTWADQIANAKFLATLSASGAFGGAVFWLIVFRSYRK